MLHSYYFGSNTFIGLDIQPDEIRLLQLSFADLGISVGQAALIDLPEGAIVDGQIHQASIIRQRLQILVKKTRTAGQFAAIAFPMRCIMSKKLQMTSDLDELERAAEIDDNLSNYFPEYSQALTYDFVVLNKQNQHQENILLLAACDDQLVSYYDLVQKAGLKVKIIDVDVYALARAVVVTLAIPLQVIPFVVVSDRIAYFIIIHKNEVIFQQQFINKTSIELGQQLNHGLQFFYKNYTGMPIQKMYLSGRVSTLSEWIKAELAIDTEYINPFQNIAYPKELAHILQKMLLCYGLAIRGKGR